MTRKRTSFAISSQLVDVLKQRIMVAELVGRGQSGSPVNGETPHLNSNMPSSHEMYPTSSSPASDGYGYMSPKGSSKDMLPQRKQRLFTPDNQKDDSYWDRRRRNNEAAKRSREKRRLNDMVLEQRVLELTRENAMLRAQLETIREEFGIAGDQVGVSMEKVLAAANEMPLPKRAKLSGPIFGSPSPIPTSVIHQPMLMPSSPSPQPHQPHHPPTSHHPPPASHPDYHRDHRDHRDLRDHREHVEFQQYAAFTPYHPSPIHYPSESNNALNLSRSRYRGRTPPYDVSSNSGDESAPLALTTTEANNSLPLKLRHKQHLGEKDAANTLLSLQNIKQEPEPEPRSSPRYDTEGSSDERDSGISLGTNERETRLPLPAEWAAANAAAATLQNLHQQPAQGEHTKNNTPMHCELARLTNEVAYLRSIIPKNAASDKRLP